MPDFLRDSIWQFWGAVFGLGAILVTLAAIWYQRGRKSLSYEVVSDVPLLRMSGEVKSRVKILFDDKPVESVRLLVLKLYNSGNTPIAPADYVRPVSVTFPDTVQLVDTEVLATDPKNLGAVVRVEGQVVTLDPVLLNRGDSVTLKFMLAQSTGAFDVDGRIIGVKQVQAPSTRSLRILQRSAIFSILFVISLGLAFVTMRLAYLHSLWIFMPPFVVALGGYLFIVKFLFRDSD